jgi:hypothetical protein
MGTEAIVVGAGALDVARRVGPTAWTVLMALAMDAEKTGDGLVAPGSVRSLGRTLGLNKDTVARALVGLRRARLVVPVAGRFEAGAYRLTFKPCLIAVCPGDKPCLIAVGPGDDRSGQVRTSPLHRRNHRSGEQLALLEAD